MDLPGLIANFWSAIGAVSPVASLRAKIELREAQLGDAHAKNETLKNENHALKAENAQLRKTVEDHQAHIERINQPSERNNRRDYDPFENLDHFMNRK